MKCYLTNIEIPKKKIPLVMVSVSSNETAYQDFKKCEEEKDYTEIFYFIITMMIQETDMGPIHKRTGQEMADISKYADMLLTKKWTIKTANLTASKRSNPKNCKDHFVVFIYEDARQLHQIENIQPYLGEKISPMLSDGWDLDLSQKLINDDACHITMYDFLTLLSKMIMNRNLDLNSPEFNMVAAGLKKQSLDKEIITKENWYEIPTVSEALDYDSGIIISKDDRYFLKTRINLSAFYEPVKPVKEPYMILMDLSKDKK